MPETAEEWKARIGIGSRIAALRTAGGPGTTKTTAVERDTAPGIAGTRTEHWSGRVDACAIPTVTKNPNLKARTE